MWSIKYVLCAHLKDLTQVIYCTKKVKERKIVAWKFILEVFELQIFEKIHRTYVCLFVFIPEAPGPVS